MNYEDPRAVMHGPFMNWNHVDCFVSRRDELNFTADKSPTIMTGFMDLREKDRDMLFAKLGKGDKKAAATKRKSEDDDDEGVSGKRSAGCGNLKFFCVSDRQSGDQTAFHLHDLFLRRRIEESEDGKSGFSIGASPGETVQNDLENQRQTSQGMQVARREL